MTKWLIVVVAVVLTALALSYASLVFAGNSSRAGAAAPLDNASLTPDDPSEIAGSGYLLTDPTPTHTSRYWAGPYSSVPGLKSYCIDHHYDYPRASYGYVSDEVNSWPGRPGSNTGADGHNAARIVYILNMYGQSPSARTNAAVSMAINLLNGDPDFANSYQAYYRPQLALIDADIPAQIEAMLADSDRFAGPYSATVSMNAAPAMSGEATAQIVIRSGTGDAVPDQAFEVVSITNGELVSAPARTGADGTAMLTYRAHRPGALTLTIRGTEVPNVTMRLAHSPTHSGTTFSSGSQRVAAASATARVPTAAGTGSVMILPPEIVTSVVDGNAVREVGTAVSDHVRVTNLVPGAQYTLQATLSDERGRLCGVLTLGVTAAGANGIGGLTLDTPVLPTCGTGYDTFSESLRDSTGAEIATSVPGQPPETFPVRPSIKTDVIGGTGPRAVGDMVADRVTISGLRAGVVYVLHATLQDAAGLRCGSVSQSVLAQGLGDVSTDLPMLATCGEGSNTFAENLTDVTGAVLATSPPGLASETFPIVATYVVPPVPEIVRLVPPTVAPPEHPPTTASDTTKATTELPVTGPGAVRSSAVAIMAVGCGVALLLAGSLRRRARGRHS